MKLTIELQKPGNSEILRKYKSTKTSAPSIPRVDEYIEINGTCYTVTAVFHILDNDEVHVRVR